MDDSSLRYKQLLDSGIVVRNPSNNTACENTLRISVGLAEENNALIRALRTLDTWKKYSLSTVTARWL